MNISLIALLASLALCALGCGGSTQDAVNVRLSAKESYEAAEEAFEAKDFSLAEKKYANALEGGGLYPDLIETAWVMRAISRAELGDVDQALNDLNELEHHAMQLDIVYAAQSFVLAKKGDSRGASVAWNKARRINRAVKKFSD